MTSGTQFPMSKTIELWKGCDVWVFHLSLNNLLVWTCSQKHFIREFHEEYVGVVLVQNGKAFNYSVSHSFKVALCCLVVIEDNEMLKYMFLAQLPFRINAWLLWIFSFLIKDDRDHLSRTFKQNRCGLQEYISNIFVSPYINETYSKQWNIRSYSLSSVLNNNRYKWCIIIMLYSSIWSKLLICDAYMYKWCSTFG
jgi:hypothetical protein